MALVCVYLPWSVFPKWAAEQGKPAPDDENSTRPPDYNAAAPSLVWRASNNVAGCDPPPAAPEYVGPTLIFDVEQARLGQVNSGASVAICVLISGSDQSHAIKALGSLNTTYQLRDGRVAMKFSDKVMVLGRVILLPVVVKFPLIATCIHESK
ncbi:hypothetical protein A9K55_008638 [Cordyceps militaris]|uniref:Uncharacterized protein n=1 Tax=Cordyceps militaris TaxID=73501 RepID=A0A2H4SGM3_CORMI|nr:hypothetical protein A9K55_008638 [Cordyceps militaris]